MKVLYKGKPQDAYQEFIVDGQTVYIWPNLDVVHYDDAGHPKTVGKLSPDLDAVPASIAEEPVLADFAALARALKDCATRMAR